MIEEPNEYLEGLLARIAASTVVVSSMCMVCGRGLKDPNSIQKGVGPICDVKGKAQMIANRMSNTMQANYVVVRHAKNYILIRDLGPWDQYATVTNAAENVVDNLKEALNGRRLFYYDSEGDLGELLVQDGRFAGFKHASELPVDI